MKDFVVTCPLVPSVPHLVSGSYSPLRIFGSASLKGIKDLQTLLHDKALALLLNFGTMNTGYEDSHPVSYKPCPAHTVKITCLWN